MSPIPHRKPRLHGVAALGAVVALAALAGCVTRTREVVVERPQAPAVIVQQQPVAGNAPSVRAMPGPIAEERGVAPGAGYSWLSGHWRYDGTRWVWQPGRWVQGSAPPMPAAMTEQMGNAPSATHYWVPGYWEWRATNNAWVWVPGAWRS